MDIVDVIGMSLGTARDKKMRFVLNLVGILIGCAAVGGLISITDGMRQDITGQIMSFGPNVINVYPDNDGLRIPVELNWRDLRMVQAIEGVENATPMNFGGTCAYKARGNYYYTSVIGVSDAYFRISGAWRLVEGRYLTRSDKGVAVVTERMMKPDGMDEPIYELGDRVTVTYRRPDGEHTYTFRIVGVITDSASGMGGGAGATMYVPLNAFDKMYNMNGQIHLIKLCAANVNNVQAVADKIKDKMGYVDVYTLDMSMDRLDNVMNTLNAMLGGIAGLSLIVAGVGIINTMTVSVMERTKEIGTLKAIGAKRYDILQIFLTEAIFTGVIGGIIGALFGFGLSYIIGHFTEIPASASPTLGVLIVGFAMVTCVISGLHPAWRASKLNPVEALRHD